MVSSLPVTAGAGALVARSRRTWVSGLLGAAAGAVVALAAMPASAQVYVYREYYGVRAWGPRYAEPIPVPPLPIPGPGRRVYAPEPRYVDEMPLPRGAAARVARNAGLAAVSSIRPAGDAYIVEGTSRRGQRLRVVVDAYDGSVIERQALAGRVVRDDPPVRAAPRREARAVAPPVQDKPRVITAPPAARPEPARPAPEVRAPEKPAAPAPSEATRAPASPTTAEPAPRPSPQPAAPSVAARPDPAQPAAKPPEPEIRLPVPPVATPVIPIPGTPPAAKAPEAPAARPAAVDPKPEGAPAPVRREETRVPAEQQPTQPARPATAAVDPKPAAPAARTTPEPRPAPRATAPRPEPRPVEARPDQAAPAPAEAAEKPQIPVVQVPVVQVPVTPLEDAQPRRRPTPAVPPVALD